MLLPAGAGAGLRHAGLAAGYTDILAAFSGGRLAAPQVQAACAAMSQGAEVQTTLAARVPAARGPGAAGRRGAGAGGTARAVQKVLGRSQSGGRRGSVPSSGSATGRLAADGGSPVHPGPWPRWPQPSAEDEAAVLEVLRAGTWCAAAQGAAVVEGFEAAFADLHRPGPGAAASVLQPAAADLRAVAVSSGTSALILALEAAGVGPGDEVLVPPYTFIATASACLFVGAVPVFCDVEPRTLCLDPAAAAAAWTPRTRAVVAVHFGGCPADLPALCALCQERGAALVEDACQAPGAAWAGRPVGSWGSFGCFSFQESKNLSAGEGGAVTGSGEGIERVWSLHNVGRRRGGAWYGHDLIGQNARLTAFQAALLRSQLARLPAQQALREAAARRLGALLAAVPGIEPLLPGPEVTTHAWHLFPFRYRREAFGGHSREEFLRALAAEGVPASAGYSLLSDNAALRRRAAANAALAGTPAPAAASLPVATAAAGECAWLYQSLLLAGEDGAEAIAAAMAKIRRAWG